MNTTVLVCLALMGLLVFVLGANVTRLRATRGATGDQAPTDPTDRLLIAVRTHGNAAEYVPTLMVLVVLCATLAEGWWVTALAVAALVARLLHALGMLTARTLATHGPLRDAGAMGTYLVGAALAVTAIVSV